MWKTLYTDFERYHRRLERYNGRVTPLNMSQILRLLSGSPGAKAIVVYRFGRWVHARRRSVASFPLVALFVPLHWLMAWAIRLAYDIHLDSSAEIGPGLLIRHLGGIHLSGCRIGAYCTVYQQVEVRPAGPGVRGPVLGDHVWLGPHAKVIGDIGIGDRTTVGAGCLVTRDVPSTSLVMGNPVRVVSRHHDQSKGLGFSLWDTERTLSADATPPGKHA